MKSVGAVQIVGPKWCGKSRTAKRYAKTTIDLMKKNVRDQFVPIAKQSPDVLSDYDQTIGILHMKAMDIDSMGEGCDKIKH